MMMTAQMLGLASGAGQTTGGTAAPAVSASAPADPADTAAAPSGAGSDAPNVFSALMRGLSARSRSDTGEVDPGQASTGDGTASAPGTTAEATTPAEKDAAGVAPQDKPLAGHDGDLPGMAMPLLPAAIDLSLNAAVQAAAAAVVTATGATDSRRPNAGGPAAALNTSATAAATAGASAAGALSPWPATSGNARAAATGRSAANDDAVADSGSGRPAALALAGSSDSGDRGNAARDQSVPTASASPLPDASALPVQSNELAAVTVKLPADAPSQWRQALTDALGDRLQVQVSRNIDQAVIRLDPPNLGRIDISISQSSGNLQVHLSASNTDVLRQLHDVGANLRQDLAHRQYGDVAVTVAEAQTRGGDPRQRARQAWPDDERGPGKALAEAEAEHAPITYRSPS